LSIEFATGVHRIRPGRKCHREERSDAAISKAERTGRGIATSLALLAMTIQPSADLFSS
jgi:hypothetical protein